ncbi:altronate hydrolase [Microbacter margulisiae]|uniref:Altronate hydrolase n=2 Tax=Microbacter margulisiae TaxID=1350067 RepID=A0A7W5DPX3_9PORP|nr:altronate dehydratase family protein [Microbacter margulisiae]MBB3186578.1 altronate hydrolase [Microbacter margulisiae]
MQVLKIHSNDNVAVALTELHAGEQISLSDGQLISVKESIPVGHKIALTPFTPGDLILKYGYSIGHAIQAIEEGGWVNEKNVRTNLEGVRDYSYTPIHHTLAEENRHMTFNGYVRRNGEVGIRNEIWIIPTVGCVNGTIRKLADLFRNQIEGKGVDAVVDFPHNFGCSQLGSDHENTRNILRDIVLHPNAGGILVVGLGCENNQVSAFRDILGDYDKERVLFMETQKIEGDEIATGLSLLRQLYGRMKQDKRQPVPLSALRVGLKCGGSDGFSGITANPLLGSFSDFLVAQGGTTVLTEVPEMFGAETILMNRCNDEHVFAKTVHLINNFKEYFIQNHQPIYENPSPGNKAGGISTLEEKSLGCTQKSGTSLVQDVLQYGDRIQKHGLNLLSAPGNDLVATTALGSAGCQLVLFTTGRGTPFGSFIPTVKVSTNTKLAIHKTHWIDFNAGSLLENTSMIALREQFIDFLLKVINGEKINAEKNNFREIAIFKTGVTL